MDVHMNVNLANSGESMMTKGYIMIEKMVKGMERYARTSSPVRAYDDVMQRNLRCAIWISVSNRC